jgi:hypothetical protein
MSKNLWANIISLLWKMEKSKSKKSRKAFLGKGVRKM